MQPDEIPQLPDMNPDDYYQEDEESAISQFRNANRKIMFYENDNGQLCVLFKKLDDVFYAEFVASFSRPTERVVKLRTFLKLCLEGVRTMISCTKKGYLTTLRIEKYIKKENHDLHDLL